MESAIDNPHSKQKLGDDTTVATLNDEIMRLRFSGDSRIKDLKMMFDNTKSFRLHLEIAPHSSEQDVSNEQQSLLQCLANRTFSLALGRAMFTLSCAPPIPTEAIPIPDVNISARLPPLNAVINLDITSLSSDLKDWPEFHEGVAAGLCIPSSESGMEIDGSWIYYNQDAPDSCKHAGFLMALGVSGHLKKMVSWHSYVYLVPKHDLTTIGLMLGLGAAYVGTMDHLVTKLLCVHIPALLPPSSSELNTSKLIQAASLFGIGLAYMGTAHRGMMEACLAEIGGKRRLTSSVNDGGASGIGGNGSACAATESAHIECYSLAAGFALGFIVLGKGERAGTLAERNIVDELHSFIVGVNQSEQKNGARHLSNKSSSSTTASTTFPAESIYTDVTSPGATVALTLMFLKTNSLRIAEKLILPSTRFMLDYFRPDFLLLRVTCRNLIMWDHIQPTKEWVLSQVPSFIRELLDDLGHEKHNWRQSSPPRTTTTWTNATADADIEGFQHAFFNMVAGACFAVGLKFAGSAHSAAFQTLSHWVDFFIKSTSLPGNISKKVV